MLLWLIPKIDQFPRKQKFLLGERIERTALDFMGQLQRAKYERKRKKAALMEAHVTFEQFKTLIRLAVGLNLISVKKYEYLSRYFEGHLQSDGYVAKSDPALLLKEIESFEALRKKHKSMKPVKN